MGEKLNYIKRRVHKFYTFRGLLVGKDTTAVAFVKGDRDDGFDNSLKFIQRTIIVIL